MSTSTMRFNGIPRTLLLLAAAMSLHAADAPAQDAARAASRIDTFTVTIPQLGDRERTVRVYLPPGYDGGDARYPVLYLQDGQNLFTPGAYGDWRVDETLDSLVAAG
ncbi:alpha/beta hydrolase-fold protein, partial [Longimicrobium sp.]|uniref:alpha/beta hydrolase-fold protein n=1 Tax=Longimicrobium sp. TaxID=2029185 RepID=UPI002E375075